METLVPDTPIATKEPVVLLDTRELKPGRYVVQLVVSGARGKSAPAELAVMVVMGDVVEGGIR